jgi:hypothetical protein
VEVTRNIQFVSGGGLTGAIQRGEFEGAPVEAVEPEPDQGSGLAGLSKGELLERARGLGLDVNARLKKDELVALIEAAEAVPSDAESEESDEDEA